MSATIIDGKAIAAEIKTEIAVEVQQMRDKGHRAPHLAAVLVGHDGGSETYVKNKVLACEACGFDSTLIRYEDSVTELELLERIRLMNEDEAIDGFIVQLPLPRHINEQRIIEAINVGKMLIGLPAFVSATPLGILTLLRRYNIATKGKKCVVMGRSNIVGKPMVQLMLQKEGADCTVTCVHSHTENVAEECRTADILIAALGQPEFVKADMVKPGAVVVDVGTTRVPDPSRASGYRLSGDVDFSAVSQVASAITPVPGGVGPMTICMLMKNTLEAAKQRRNISTE